MVSFNKPDQILKKFMTLNGKKFLITGAVGFISSHLILELQKRFPDAEIIGYDNLLSGDFRNLEGFNGEFLSCMGELASLWMKEFDVIFHLGSNTDTTNSSLKDQLKNNIDGARIFLGLKAKTFIYASSASVYGVGATKPSVETDDLRPANAYAFSKVQLEKIMTKYNSGKSGNN